MTTQYTPILKLALPVTGELSGTWGDVVNNNITSMVEQAIAGLSTINTWTANSHTLTTANGTTSEARCAMLVADDDGAGNPSAAATIICPAAAKLYVLKNISGQAVTLKTSGGTGVSVPHNDTAFLFCDGTNVEACVTTIVNGHIAGNLTVDGNTTLGDAAGDTVTINAATTTVVQGTANTVLYLNASKVISGAVGFTWDGSTLAVPGSISATVSANNAHNITATNTSTGTSGQTNLYLIQNDTTARIASYGSTHGTRASTAWLITSEASRPIVIAPSNAEVGRFTSTGLAVTGTLSATGDFSVTGAAVNGYFNSDTGAFRWRTAAGVEKGAIRITGNDLKIEDAGGTERLRIVNGSGVSVTGTLSATGTVTGTAVPFAFTASGSVGQNHLFQSTNGTQDVRLGIDGSNNCYTGTVSNHDFLVQTNGSTRGVFSSTGFAVTGTLSATGSGKLTTFGSSSATNSYSAWQYNNADVGYIGNGAGVVAGAAATDFGITAFTGGKLWLGANNGSGYAVLDTSGNLGLGVTPSAHSGLGPALQIGQPGSVNIFGQYGQGYIGTNVYYNSGYKYQGSYAASMYVQNSGQHIFYTAPSGTAGNPITFTQAMTLDASGNLANAGTYANAQITTFNIATSTNYSPISIAGDKNVQATGGIGSPLLLNSHDTASVRLSSTGIQFSVGAAAECARIDSSGNLLVGTTTTPSGSGNVALPAILNRAIGFNLQSRFTSDGTSVAEYGLTFGSSSGSTVQLSGYDGLKFFTANTERARITSGGDFGVGMTPTYRLDVSKAGGTDVIVDVARIYADASANSSSRLLFGTAANVVNAGIAGWTESATGGQLRFYTEASSTLNEVARLTETGNLLVGQTSGGFRITGRVNAATYVGGLYNDNATPLGLLINYSAAAPNDTGKAFLQCDDTGGLRAQFRSNGGLANYSANNVNLSDERMKKDFAPAKSYYAQWKDIEFVTFLYKDQTDEELNLGVKAQQLESVFPELIDNSGFGEAPEGEEPYKAVYQTDFQYATARALQEAIAKIEELTARIAALEAQ